MTHNQRLSLVIQSPRNVLRDMCANGYWIANLLILLVYYVLISTTLFYYTECSPQNGCDPQVASWYDSLYFTIINLTTVGFGDIHPISNWGKSIAIANSLVGVVYFGVMVACITTALQSSSYEGACSISGQDAGSAQASATPENRDVIMALNSICRIIEKSHHSAHSIRVITSADEAPIRKVDITIDIFVHAHQNHTNRPKND